MLTGWRGWRKKADKDELKHKKVLPERDQLIDVIAQAVSASKNFQLASCFASSAVHVNGLTLCLPFYSTAPTKSLPPSDMHQERSLW